MPAFLESSPAQLKAPLRLPQEPAGSGAHVATAPPRRSQGCSGKLSGGPLLWVGRHDCDGGCHLGGHLRAFPVLAAARCGFLSPGVNHPHRGLARGAWLPVLPWPAAWKALERPSSSWYSQHRWVQTVQAAVLRAGSNCQALLKPTMWQLSPLLLPAQASSLGEQSLLGWCQAAGIAVQRTSTVEAIPRAACSRLGPPGPGGGLSPGPGCSSPWGNSKPASPPQVAWHTPAAPAGCRAVPTAPVCVGKPPPGRRPPRLGSPGQQSKMEQYFPFAVPEGEHL